MARRSGDGGIVLDVTIDENGLSKGLNKIKGAIQNVNKGIRSTGVQLTQSLSKDKSVARLQKEFEKTNESIDKTKAKIGELYAQLDELQANAFKAPDTQEPVLTNSEQKQFDKLNAQLDELEPKLERDKIKAQELGNAIKSASKGSVPGLKAVTKGIDNFGKRIASLVKRVFVFSIILKALRALLGVIKNVAMGDEEFRKSLDQLQAALWVAFTPILNVVVPALKTLVNWLTQVVIWVGKFFAAISGKSYAQMIENAKGLKKQADGYKKLGKNAKDAKKQLAGFDDLQILSQDSASGDADANSNIFEKFSGGSEVNDMLAAIMGVVGGAMVALGVLLLFYGQIGWGIGFIIAGATTMGVNIAAIGDSDLGIAEKFSSMMAIVSGFVLALGLVLFFKCKSPVAQSIGLGMIIAGAGVLAVSAAQMAANNIGGEIGKMLHGIIAIVSGFLLAIGLIMLFSGQITPLSIGLVVTGAVGLASEVALYPDAVKEALQGWVGGILAIISGALLVLGIILCFTPVSWPIAIGLIAAGAVGLASVAVINWDLIKTKSKEVFTAIGDWVKTWGLLVLGIILCITGVGIPWGISLIKQGAGNLTEAQDPMWMTIVDKVKEIWGKIQEFWNKHIAKIFTKEWWYNLGKKMMNGLIAAVEAGINKILEKFHSANIGKAIDFVAGGLGFDIPKSIKIPRLARGAVIPPNREFLAVLGDQKQGMNIEAPLQTIVDAFNIALQGNANYGGGNTEVVLEIDGREFGRAVVEQGNRESRRIGTRLVIA